MANLFYNQFPMGNYHVSMQLHLQVPNNLTLTRNIDFVNVNNDTVMTDERVYSNIMWFYFYLFV